MTFSDRYINHLKHLSSLKGGVRLVAIEEDFSGQDLTGLDLSRASFLGCNLTSTQFRSSNLSTTDFTGSDMTGADLSFCNMSNTVLTSATLLNNRLRETIGNKHQIKSLQIGNITVTYSHDKRFYDCLELEVSSIGSVSDEYLASLHPAALDWHNKWAAVVDNIITLSPAKAN